MTYKPMMRLKSCAVVGAALWLGACQEAPNLSCASLSRDQAIAMASRAKRGMLSRSVSAEGINYGRSMPAEVLLDDNGYAAKVGYQGKDGSMLVALIEDDCYVGWTRHDAK